MANAFLVALRENRFIPTRHWQPRCELCRLMRDLPEAFEWLSRELRLAKLTQQQIADGLREQWGVEVTQGQVSTHRTRHFQPDWEDAHETFIASRALLQFCGDMPPDQMAVVYAQLAIMALGAQIKAAGPKEAAGIGNAIAALSRALQTGSKLPAELDQAALDVHTARMRSMLAEGDLREAFVGYVEQHYPQLLPALAGGETGDG